METHCYNIDSKFRNTTSYPNSSDFVFNRVDELIGSSYSVEPFNEKNVIEMKITSLEMPNTIYYILNSRGNNTLLFGATTIVVPDGSYLKQDLVDYLHNLSTLTSVDVTYSSSTGKVTIVNGSGNNITFPASGTNYYSLGTILGFTTGVNAGTTGVGTYVMKDPQQLYLFLRINDFGNVINKNRRYVTKIVTDTQSTYQQTSIKVSNHLIKFDQPTDIPQLRISLEDEYGNLISLNGNNFSFTLEVVVITNTILKNFSEIRFYKEEVMDRILKAKMLSYYEKQADDKTNNTLTTTYNSNLINLNSQQEYNTFGSSNNYAPSFSYFKEKN